MVTAIEILSPWNKLPGRLNEAYRQKLVDYGRGGVSVVEVDLLRSPRGRLMGTDLDLPTEPPLSPEDQAWAAEVINAAGRG